jgi:hypothetical protein
MTLAVWYTGIRQCPKFHIKSPHNIFDKDREYTGLYFITKKKQKHVKINKPQKQTQKDKKTSKSLASIKK